jgi:cellulose synthase/poly-beta-1,6-N-acetylglucosamine synthase-like glycosyltransferase
MVSYLILGIYSIALIYITLFCMMQLNILYYYKTYRKKNPFEEPTKLKSTDDNLPFVTVQLPIYNEYYVITRLIDYVAAFDYPKDKFEIHILDDSTDETVDLVRQKVAHYKALGFNIEQVRREVRQGFKAGALRDATHLAKGELIAIFDADFLPRPDFLLATVGHFKNPKVGVVQSRWEHINRDYSLITKLQAFHLDMHFTVEQKGREAADCLLQFNGTAGVWRKSTIAEAGGWEADTLTEDLDLSYRAQLKGWKIIFLERLGSPAELPAEMNGFKSQQFRWSKGGAETARKMLPIILKSDLTLKQKIHAVIHLTGSSVFVFVFISAILSVPLTFLEPILGVNYNYLGIFFIGMVSLVFVYYEANVRASIEKHSYMKLFFKFVVLFPTFLALTMGLSLHNTIAVLQGYLGKKSDFIRTPKFNIVHLNDTFKKSKYVHKNFPWTTLFEILLAIYFLCAAIGGWFFNSYFLPYHLMLAIGFGYVSYLSIKHFRYK